ncbi:hypothetical protein M0R04_11915 [Candidatus Dojkabacteria bacterium]|jgi:hypothetical protein|nr:hypothetical protein [Candidatus Dojkabacteria bacterium]
MAINWRGVNENMRDVGSQLSSYFKEQQAKKDAVQAIFQKALIEQQIKKQAMGDLFDQYKQSGFLGNQSQDGQGQQGDYVPVPTGNPEQPFKFESNLGARKFQAEQKEKSIQQDKETTFIKDTALDSLNTVKKVKEGISNFGATGPLWSTPWDYKRKLWEANVNKLLSSKIVDLITQMKSASKTGATGFGQLSDREGQILREASTALNRGLAPKDALAYLDSMEKILNKVVAGQNEEYQVGQTMEKGGKTYTYVGNGQWEY